MIFLSIKDKNLVNNAITMDNINENVLKNCYKNAQMAIYSLEDVIPKCKGNLKGELLDQHEGYNRHLNECALTATKLSISLPNVNGIAKGMLNASINVQTLTDDSDSHIAEMTLKGTVKGYTTLIKDISQFGPLLHEEVLQRITQLKEYEEVCEERLKKYL